MPEIGFGIIEYKLTSMTISQGDLSLIEISNGPRDISGGLRFRFTLTTADWIKLPAKGSFEATRKFDNGVTEIMHVASMSCGREHLNHVYAVLSNERPLSIAFGYSGDRIPVGGSTTTDDGQSFGKRELHYYRLQSGTEPIGELEDILNNLS